MHSPTVLTDRLLLALTGGENGSKAWPVPYLLGPPHNWQVQGSLDW